MAKRKKRQKNMHPYSISEVFEYIDASPTNGQKIIFHGHKIHFRSTKLLNFRNNGITCIKCNRKGGFFNLEGLNSSDPYLNLYGFDKSGGYLLFTKDHIRPKRLGGTNNLYNMQTMCLKCNVNKGHKWHLRYKIKYYFNRLKYFLTKRRTI